MICLFYHSIYKLHLLHLQLQKAVGKSLFTRNIEVGKNPQIRQSVPHRGVATTQVNLQVF